jgi:hypothetical protein
MRWLSCRGAHARQRAIRDAEREYDRSPPGVLDAVAISYEGEAADARTARRIERWTPVAVSIET